MSLKREGTIAFVWDFAGKLANQGVGFVISIFLARLLMPEDFGVIAMINVVIGLAAIFVDVGLSGALIQRKRLLAVHYNSVFYFNTAVGFLLSMALFLLAPILEGFYEVPGLTLYARALSPIFFLSSLNSVQSTRLRKGLKFDKITKSQFASALGSGIIGLSMAVMGYGIWSLIFQQLVQTALGVVLLWNAGGWRPGFQFSSKALKQLWGFGFNMFLSGLLNDIIARLDVIFIGKVFTASTLGFYHRARSLDSMISRYTSGSIMQVAYPVLSKLQHESIRFRAVVEKILHLISFAAFGLVGIFFMSGEEVIILLFGQKWLPSVDYFKIMILASYAYPVNSVLVNVLKGKGNSKSFLRLEVLKQGLLLLNVIYGLSYGITYFLYGYVVTSFFCTQLNIHFAKVEIEEKAWWLNKIIFSYGLVMIGVIVAVEAIAYSIGDLALGVSILYKSFLFTLAYLGFTFIAGFKANKNILADLRHLKLIRQKI